MCVLGYNMRSGVWEGNGILQNSLFALGRVVTRLPVAGILQGCVFSQDDEKRQQKRSRIFYDPEKPAQ